MVQYNGNQAGPNKMSDLVALERHLPSHLNRRFAGKSPPYFIAGTKAWVWYLCMVMAFVMTLIALSFVGLRALENKMSFAEWGLGIFCLPFLIALTRPKTWVPPIWMIADVQGLYFLGTAENEEYIFVPWQEVSETMSIERIATGNGVKKGIVILIHGESSFWRPAIESRFMSQLLQPVRSDGYRRLPLTGLGQDLKKSLAALSYLRQHLPSTMKKQQ